jgi:hypothetical protein
MVSRGDLRATTGSDSGDAQGSPPSPLRLGRRRDAAAEGVGGDCDFSVGEAHGPLKLEGESGSGWPGSLSRGESREERVVDPLISLSSTLDERSPSIRPCFRVSSPASRLAFWAAAFIVLGYTEALITANFKNIQTEFRFAAQIEQKAPPMEDSASRTASREPRVPPFTPSPLLIVE